MYRGEVELGLQIVVNGPIENGRYSSETKAAKTSGQVEIPVDHYGGEVAVWPELRDCSSSGMGTCWQNGISGD